MTYYQAPYDVADLQKIISDFIASTYDELVIFTHRQKADEFEVALQCAVGNQCKYMIYQCELIKDVIYLGQGVYPTLLKTPICLPQ